MNVTIDPVGAEWVKQHLVLWFINLRGLSSSLPALLTGTGWALMALLLIGLTVWTYLGVAKANTRRILALVGLRLVALVLALLMALRPSLATPEDNPHEESTLLVVADVSESMTIQDEYDGQARWDYLQRLLHDAEPLFQKHQDQKVKVSLNQFAEDVRAFDANAKADGKRTDFGQMLHSLYERHGRDRNLRGLLILSDGADNGTRYPAMTEAARWRKLPCPVQTFGFGKPTTANQQSDIALVGIYPEPSPVPVKGKLTVRGIVDAPGFENATVTVHLFIDDKEVLAQQETLRKTKGNEVTLTTDAPDTVPPGGEIKVTLKVDPLPKELTTKNNQIETFVNVTNEGISVLLVDRLRVIEPQRICDALSPDPRIRLYVAWRRSDQVSPEQADLFQFTRQHYDVIILGDLSARRLAPGNPLVLSQIQDQVRKGAGLMMMGGYESFGNSDWRGTPIEDLLPVQLNAAGQDEEEVHMEPTPAGLNHYVMRLTDRPEDNGPLWAKLPALYGMTRLGDPKPTATVLAIRAGSNETVLVGSKYGEGRTLAFAGDTTWRWERLGQPQSAEGVQAHARFWKQVVFWLARRDEAQGNVWVKPDTRRLPVGDKLGFSLGLRGKGGMDLKDAHFEVVVEGPQKSMTEVPTSREQGGERGTFAKTEAPGEYLVKVHGAGKDIDGTEASGDTTARIVVYQDDAEMMRWGADHDFLARLANAGGGKFYEAKELSNVLKDLLKQPPAGKQKVQVWPEWRRPTLSGFLVGFFVLFVAILCLEWFLRRRWGMV